MAMLQKIYFVCSIATIYIVTLGSLATMIYSSQLLGIAVRADDLPQPAVIQQPVRQQQTISGKPVRIAIPTSSIDLPIDDGTYDTKTQTWTLSDTHAQFATMTSPTNDRKGTTFIYGHGTDAVFGKIGTNPPPAGTQALVYTDNGHTFTYVLQSVKDLTPTDTWILKNTHEGPPQLLVQTCTGVFSEWRTMFTFTLSKVT